MATKKGMRRKNAVRGARLAYDAVPAKVKRKVGTKIGKRAGVQSAVRKAKGKGVTAKRVAKGAKMAHGLFQ